MSDAGIVAVHQPNFFPWLGFFAKILAADRFVILDDVQLKNSGGSWSNRVKVIVAGNPQWITAAIDRGRPGLHTIADSAFTELPWRDKIVRSIAQSYAKAPHFQEASELLSPLVMQPTANIADYNVRAIVAICDALDIDASAFVRSSSLGIDSTATQRLIDIVRALDGTTYLSGDGAQGYQDDDLYRQSGVALRKLGFVHPVYPQGDGSQPFVAGLSIIDALMNLGTRATRAMLDEAVVVSCSSGAGN